MKNNKTIHEIYNNDSLSSQIISIGNKTILCAFENKLIETF